MPAADLFLPPVHFEQMGENTTFQSSVVRGAGVVGKIDADLKQDRRTISATYRMLDNAAQKELFDRVQSLWYGGLSVYVPTYKNDFDVLANNSGLTLTVKANGFGTIYDQVCAQRVDLPWLYTSYGLMAVTHDAKRHFFKLGNPSNITLPTTGPAEPNVYVDNGNGTATLYLKVSGAEAAAFSAYAANQIQVCSLIVRSRMLESRLTLNAFSSAIIDTNLVWQEVFFESPFLPPAGTSGFAITILDFLGNVKGYWMMQPGNKMGVVSGGQKYVNLTGAPPVGQLPVVVNGVTKHVNLIGV
jgi:hypothetical protein